MTILEFFKKSEAAKKLYKLTKFLVIHLIHFRCFEDKPEDSLSDFGFLHLLSG